MRLRLRRCRYKVQGVAAALCVIWADPSVEHRQLPCLGSGFKVCRLRHVGARAQAQACLAVLPSSAAAAAERDAIAGVLRLRAFGVELPPLQFRQARRLDPITLTCSGRCPMGFACIHHCCYLESTCSQLHHMMVEMLDICNGCFYMQGQCPVSAA